MKEQRLLERIATWEAGGRRAGRVQVDVLVRSVVDHLRRLLNTRQGCVRLDPLFGVPDFTNISGGFAAGSVGDVEGEICRMILKYEWRIKSPKVTWERESANPLCMSFLLEGMLDIDDRSIPIRLSTAVGVNGKVSVV